MKKIFAFLFFIITCYGFSQTPTIWTIPHNQIYEYNGAVLKSLYGDSIILITDTTKNISNDTIIDTATLFKNISIDEQNYYKFFGNIKKQNIVFDRCKFIEINSHDDSYVQYHTYSNLKNLEIYNCQSQLRTIEFRSHGDNAEPIDTRISIDNINIVSGKYKGIIISLIKGINNIEVSGSIIESLDIHSCEINNTCKIDQSNIDWFSITSSTINARIDIDIFAESIRHPRFISFNNSILNEPIDINCQGLPDLVHPNSLKLLFYDCSINNRMYCDDRIRYAVFYRTKFGKDAEIVVYPDTLEFQECMQSENKININRFVSTVYPGQKDIKLHVCFNGSNLDIFDFIYSKNIEIIPSNLKEYDEQDLSTFEQLLVKFRLEGKYDSYKRMDLQIREYKKDNGKVNVLWYCMQKYFWNFGYYKWLPIFWLIIILLIFSILNLIVWDNMKKVYYMDEDDEAKERNDIGIVAKASEKYVTIFKRVKIDLKYLTFSNFLKIIIYTVSVFFSIKVANDNINLKGKNRWIYFYFSQYLFGIFFLYFIINFVFNISDPFYK